MQPKGPFLPEFYALREHCETGPVSRSRYRRVTETMRKLVHQPLERGSAGERLRLLRRPGTNLTVARSGSEIGIRLLVCDEFGDTLDTNLAVQRLPQKAQGGMRIGEQLPRFSAFEVGVKDKPALIEALQQHGADRRSAIRCRRRQHRRMCVGLALPGFVEPTPERLQRFDLGNLVYHPGSSAATAPTYSVGTFSAMEIPERQRTRRCGAGSRVSAISDAIVVCIAAASALTIRSIAGATSRCQGADACCIQRRARGKCNAS